MRVFGGFDLSVYDDVVEHYAKILERLEKGDMPCDAPWPVSRIDTFKQWGSEKFPP